MLSDQHGLDRYPEWLDRIEHPETQDAFRCLAKQVGIEIALMKSSGEVLYVESQE
jgi:hypothetical protein